MAVSYKKLWKLLIDKEMMKKDLRAMTGVSTTTMSRLSKDENVSTEILSKICSALNCDVGDIMEFDINYATLIYLTNCRNVHIAYV